MLKERAAKARAIVYEATAAEWLRQQIMRVMLNWRSSTDQA